ncbi:MAG: T9SS type A sorting domain-containing protein [Bacteroidetes bacterium]|nr:T9SS type A sorting domain-containing protein [Bacteroidota bacterium]
MKQFICTALFYFAILFAFGQQYPAFYQSALIEVFDEKGDKYDNAFGGGLKFPVFSSIDLNFDGKNDLLVLDKIDDRILPFIYSDSLNYSYRPQYEPHFPVITRYLHLKDYNGDGLADIFAFASDLNSGIEVYKNVSTPYHIEFEKVQEQLEALYFNSFKSLIYVNSIDIPAIEDLDGDGDLDILTFGVIGQTLDYFENLSMEKYGIADSFDFEYADACWGKFIEDDLTNDITLGFSCGAVRSGTERHAGSTSLLLDLDDDDDLDLLLGDVGYPGYYALVNGKNDFSWPVDTIISYEKKFPSYDSSVIIKNMPAGFYLDVNQDGLKDLVVSPQDMEFIDTFQSLNQVWLYLNDGQNNKPDLKFIANDFLQNEMIDLGGRSSPSFFDFDQDGDLDLIVSTIGDYNQSFYHKDRLVLFENEGSKSNPEFHLKDKDYANISSLNLRGIKASFGDMDGDGDKDLLLGKSDGKLAYFENTAASGQQASFNWISNSFQNIDVGDFSTPCLHDVNGDLLPDLIIGEQYATLKYYENTGSASSPVFSLAQDTFGKVSFDLFLRQYAQPQVYDLNANGKDELIIGTRDDNIYYVADFKDHLNDSFQLKKLHIRDSSCSCKLNRLIGQRLSVAFADLFDLAELDMIVGSERGGLLYYSTRFDNLHISREEKTNLKLAGKMSVFPNPFVSGIQIQMKDHPENYRVVIGDVSGKCLYQQGINHLFNGRIQLPYLKDGFYILSIQDEKGKVVYREKILKINQ